MKRTHPGVATPRPVPFAGGPVTPARYPRVADRGLGTLQGVPAPAPCLRHGGGMRPVPEESLARDPRGPRPRRWGTLAAIATAALSATLLACRVGGPVVCGRACPGPPVVAGGAAPAGAPAGAAPAAGQAAGEALDPEVVTSSRSCAACHPAIYAEHMQNTHGAAFVDEEARLATRDFRRENCVRCHTPRPLSETGPGMVPFERRHDLEEGNTCMSCHAKAGYDYAHFKGNAECKVAFDPEVGKPESCATCHRIAGTPEQWEHAQEGKLAGRACVVCHMPLVERPVAVGMPSRQVRAHLFPASRSESQVRSAYSYEARIEGDEAVVAITNVGAGHNFPTATIQRSVESLIVVRDAQGKEVASDRATFGHPYFDPVSLDFRKPTQIPSGNTREHRVRLPAGGGTVETSLFFKIYHPVADDHPTLSRRLERRRLTFENVTPVAHEPPPKGPPGGLPEVTPADARRPVGLAKFAHPPPGTTTVAIPPGDSPEDVERLVAILEFPVPGARIKARERLVAMGERAVPALIDGLAHWSDETRDESLRLLEKIGAPALKGLEAALSDPRLYVRYHARMALSHVKLPPDQRARVRDALIAATSAAHPLDRRSACDALVEIVDPAAAPALRARLDDPDADVVAAAAKALARLDDVAAVPAMTAAFRRAPWVETRRDLAGALAALGSGVGVPMLMDGLDHRDDVIRRSMFDTFFEATGLHESYDPDDTRPRRLEALARLQSRWLVAGGTHVQRPVQSDPERRERAWEEVEALGGGTDVLPGGDDAELLERLVAAGPDAVEPLIQGLTFPSGFAEKRTLVCEALGRIGDPRAAPYLVRALRDPDLTTASWACWALSETGDEASVPALRAWSLRLGLLSSGTSSPAGTALVDGLLARAAWTREKLRDATAPGELAALKADPAVASSPPPARAPETIATTEAPPVAAPTSPGDAVAKAQVLRQQDYYEDAVRVLKDADARFGETAPVRLETAWNLLMIAEEDVTRDAAQTKIDAEVAVARKAFDEALRMDAKVEGKDLLEAKLLRYEGSVVQARMLFKDLSARFPDDPDVHREHGDFAYVNGDWTTAEREYAALFRLHPKDGWALLYSTISKQWLEHPAAELEASYLDAVRLLPEESMPLERLAALYADDAPRDVANLEKVLAERPQSVMTRVVLSRFLAAHGDPARATKLLAEALTIAPSSPAAHLEAARQAKAGGRLAEAVEHAMTALAATDKFSTMEPADALDDLLTSDGAAALPPEVRKRAWDAAIARNPPLGKYAHDAGVWLLDVAHLPAEAVPYLQRAVRIDPSDEAFRKDLERAKEAGGKGR